MPALTTSLAIGALASTGVTTVASFMQVKKQRAIQAKAEKEAEKYIKEARRRLDVNYYKGLSVKKEPYELEREALLSSGAQALEGAREGNPAGIAGTAGRVQMAQNESEAAIRTAMGKELTDIEHLVKAEDSRLRDIQTQIDLEEAAGAQLAAANAEEAGNQALTEGIKGIGNFVSQGIALAPQFAKTSSARVAGQLQKEYEEQWLRKGLGAFNNIGGVDFGKIGEMDSLQFRDWLSRLDPAVLKEIEKRMMTFNRKPSVGQGVYTTPYSSDPTTQNLPIDPFGISGSGGWGGVGD